MAAIRVKSMLVLPHPDGRRHLVSRMVATPENPDGFHRFIGGSIEHGETATAAAHRELREELDATVTSVAQLAVLENIFQLRGATGHEIVFLFSGLLADPSVVPDEGRWFDDGGPVWAEWISYGSSSIPLYPAAARPAVDRARELAFGRH